MLLRDGFGAVASLAAALVPFLDGLFLFFLAIFACSTVRALLHSTSAHVCGSRVALSLPLCHQLFGINSSISTGHVQPIFFWDESGRRLGTCRPRSWSNWREQLERAFLSRFGGSAQRNFGDHEARHRNRPSKHWLANVSALFGPFSIQPQLVGWSTCKEDLH